MMDLGLEGRVALVTGGSGGIGRSVALALAREGVDVVICARKKAELEEVAGEIGLLTDRAILAIQADMTVVEDVQRFVSTALAKFRRIDILVYSANALGGGTFAEIPDEAWRTHFEVKLLGCIRCVREVIPHMRKNQWGRIVMISGMSARIIRPFAVDNGPICAGLSNFGKQIANELGPYGILVNTVHPETTKTPRILHRFEAMAKTQKITVDEIEEQNRKRFPIGRMIEPEDVANLVLFLCSQQASGITGQSIAVDGGAGTAISY